MYRLLTAMKLNISYTFPQVCVCVCVCSWEGGRDGILKSVYFHGNTSHPNSHYTTIKRL